MSNIMQTLFNTNHDQPSFLVLIVLVLIAFVVPSITKYMYESRRANNNSQPTARSQTQPTAKPRHQHKKKKR